MSRLRWSLLLSHIFAHSALSRTSHNVKSHQIILSTALTIFTLFGGWSTIITPIYPDQALAAINWSLIATHHATHEHIATRNVELSTQDLQIAVGPEHVSLLDNNLVNRNIQ